MMKLIIPLTVVVGFLIYSCRTKKDLPEEAIPGIYVKEYSLNVVNPETGKEIGNRTIRDTIFIQQLENGYEVSNTKWMLNDYGNQGWQSMEHSSDRPMPTYVAKFEEQDNLLTADLTPALFLDIKGKKLFKGKKRDKPYLKIQ